MKAAVISRFGTADVVTVAEVGTPKPRAGELLVRVHAAAVTAADARIRGANFPKGFGVMSRLIFGITRPRRQVLGSAFSGTVVQGNAEFGAGDEVCGMTGIRFGSHAEFVVVPPQSVARKPSGVSHEQAAGVLFGGATALFFLRDKGAVQPGQSVLVNGASGALGTNAVQLAKHFGAVVTAVTSTPNVELVRKLGADHVIDYTSTDLSTIPDRFDVVFDSVGNVSPALGKKLINPGGVVLLAAANLWEMLQARGPVKVGTGPERAADFEYLLGLVADGQLEVVLDDLGSLDSIVAAHAKVDSGRKVGNVVIRP